MRRRVEGVELEEEGGGGKEVPMDGVIMYTVGGGRGRIGREVRNIGMSPVYRMQISQQAQHPQKLQKSSHLL